MSRVLEDIAWELYSPASARGRYEHSRAYRGLLDELSAFRGRIWYDNGTRPQFKHEDGRMRDDDVRDAEAFHIVARSRGLLVG